MGCRPPVESIGEREEGRESKKKETKRQRDKDPKEASSPVHKTHQSR
jgi:hypothetical protein